MSEFFVGQKVVCIHNGRRCGYGDEIYAEFNKVYTVRELIMGDSGLPSLLLMEIRNAPRQYMNGFYEGCFGERFFRPLETKAIEVFRRIARDVTEGKRVRIDA